MKRTILALLAVCAMTVGRCPAAGPAEQPAAPVSAWRSGPGWPAAGPAEQPAAPMADDAGSAEMPKPVIPEREITFEVSEEAKPLPMTWAGNDSEVFEQRFVAEFQMLKRGDLQGVPNPRTHLDFVGPMGGMRGAAMGMGMGMGISRENTNQQGTTWGGETGARVSGINYKTAFRPEFLPDIAPLQDEPFVFIPHAAGVDSDRNETTLLLYRDVFGISSGSGSTGYYHSTTWTSDRIEPFLEGIAARHAPSEEVLELLRLGSPYYRIEPVQRDAEGRFISRYTILAPTPERAEELVRGVLSFSDYGVLYSLQEANLAAKRVHEELWSRYRTRLAEVQEEYAALEKSYADLERFGGRLTEAVVNNWIVERSRIDVVDMASVKARIDACNEMLKTTDIQQRARYDQIEILRTAAEIEMVGLVAKRDALTDLIEAAGTLQTTAMERFQLNSEIKRLECEIIASEEEISRYGTELKDLVPYPVEGGKVMIYPIKWTPPED